MNDGQNIKKLSPNVRLRAARENRGLSQRELADQLGTTELTVGRWERGERAPQLIFRAKLCEIFGVTAQELGLVPQTEAESVSAQASEQASEVPAGIEISDVPRVQGEKHLFSKSRITSIFNKPRNRYVSILLCVVLLCALLLGGTMVVRGGNLFVSKAVSLTPKAVSPTPIPPTPIPLTPIAIPPASAYQIPASWKLLIHDTTAIPAQSGWLNSPPGCTFANGGYDIVMTSQNYCLNTQTDNDPSFGLLHSYTYEIQLAFLRGQESGMIFCKTHKSFYKSLKLSYAPYYYFGITVDGKYVLFYDDGGSDRGLISSPSSYIKKGLKTFNTLAVTANKGEIDMYINGHLVNKFKDTYPCAGGILGVEATGYPSGNMEPTEVLYKNTRYWVAPPV